MGFRTAKRAGREPPPTPIARPMGRARVVAANPLWQTLAVAPAPASPRPQPKLLVGRSDDPLEREADRVADQVATTPISNASQPRPAQALSAVPPRIQRTCREESFYQGAANFCLDDTFSPLTHAGTRCYREIPHRDWPWSCPAAIHVCFDADGNCEESPDVSSIANEREADGTCSFNEYCIAEHTALDFAPAVLDSAADAVDESVVQPVERGLSQLMNPWNWYRLFGGGGPMMKPEPGKEPAGQDPAEQEADAAAELVAAGRHAGSMVAPRAGPACPACRGQQSGCARCGEGAPAGVDQVLAGRGRPLEPDTRGWMEHRFGLDLGAVRIHTDAAAAASAKAMGAEAYTVAQHIAFGAGRYAPQTPAGRRLLAHELAHTVQQRGADRAAEPQLLPKAHPAEEEAWAGADRVLRGAPAGVAQRGLYALAKADPSEEDEQQPATDAAKKGTGKANGNDDSAVHPGGAKYHWGWPWFDVLKPTGPKWWSEGFTGFRGLAKGDGFKNPGLMGREFVSLNNYYWAWLMQQQLALQGHDIDYEKGLKIAETLSGVGDTHFNAASFGLGFDTKKFIEDRMGHVADEHLGPLLLYGLPLGLIPTITALKTESNVDFLPLIPGALGKFTNKPSGYDLGYSPTSLSGKFNTAPWFAGKPGELKLSWEDRYAADKPQSLSLHLPFNLASALGYYPEDDKKKGDYQGLEAFSYLALQHKWANERNTPGIPSPDAGTTFMTGGMWGDKGLYGGFDLGQAWDADNRLTQLYLRQLFMMKHFGILDQLQVSSEQLHQPGEGTSWRLDAAAYLDLLKANDDWTLAAGGRFGVLMPGMGADAEYSGSGSLKLGYNPYGKDKPGATTLDVSGQYGPVNPLVHGGPKGWGIGGGLTIFDVWKIGYQYNQQLGGGGQTGQQEHLFYTGPSVNLFKLISEL